MDPDKKLVKYGHARPRAAAPQSKEVIKLNDKLNTAQLHLMNYYWNYVAQYNDREKRIKKLEESSKKMSKKDWSEWEVEMMKQENEFLRLKRTILSVSDFLYLVSLGEGAFGTVYLVRKKDNGEVYAMKVMNKRSWNALQTIYAMRMERDIMILGMSLAQIEINWIVQLFCSFQNNKFIYLVQEYCSGGDLDDYVRLNPQLNENAIRFLVAEIATALQCLHELQYIHGDLKPSNVFLDARGHVKLGDFGLSYSELETHQREFYLTEPKTSRYQKHYILKMSDLNDPKFLMKPFSYRRPALDDKRGGTMRFTAPEKADGVSKFNYMVDWWSLGVIMFELFHKSNPFDTFDSILNFRHLPSIYLRPDLSAQAKDLIQKLISIKDRRMGSGNCLNLINKKGIEEMKLHGFFKDFQWNNLRGQESPLTIKPNPYLELRGREYQEFLFPAELHAAKKMNYRSFNDWPFLNYTFRRYNDFKW